MTQQRHPQDAAAEQLEALALLVAVPLISGFIGFAGYSVAAMILEARNESSGPTLSYGQYAFLISLPLCTMLAAAIGLGVAFALIRWHLLSIVLLLLVSLSGGGIVTLLWNEQIASYGRDPSEVVLFYPPTACSVLALAIAILIGLVAAVRWRARVS